MTDTELLLHIRKVMGASPVGADQIERISEEPGAYLLLVRLGQPLRFSRKALGSAVLSGWFLYAGSAKGRGGLRGRLRRHFRPEKPVRWHIDELTNAGTDIAAIAVPGGSECAIVERMVQSKMFEPALRGFGSSDCRHCAAHLLRPASGSELPKASRAKLASQCSPI